VSEKVHFPFHQSLGTLRAFLEELFEGEIEELAGREAAFPALPSLHMNGGNKGAGGTGAGRKRALGKEEGEGEGAEGGGGALRINGCVVFHVDPRAGRGVLVWEGGPVADMVADAVLALAMEAQVSPTALQMTGTPCCAHRRAGGNEEGQRPVGARAPAEAGTEGGTEGGEQGHVASAGEGAAPPARGMRTMRRLRRVLVSVYGPSAVSWDPAIHQISLVFPGGGHGRVRWEGGRKGIVVTADEAAVEEQLEKVVRRIGGVLDDAAAAAVQVQGVGTERGGGEVKEEGKGEGLEEGQGGEEGREEGREGGEEGPANMDVH
jgi:hypothetical protein